MKILILLTMLLAQNPSRTAGIEGWVVRAGTNPPMRLVNARLELSAAGGSLVARTDASGRFAFSGLPPGQYRLRVTKDGFIRQEYPRASMDEPGIPITLTAGEVLTDIVFGLEPASTIAGLIRDDSEAPIAGVEVRALKRGYTQRGDRTLMLTASTLTDDRGRYRLYWLDPGEYFIAAAIPASSPVKPAGTTPPSPMAPMASMVSWAPTYYPGSADPDFARPIRLDSSRDIEGLEFKLTRQPMATLTGYTFSLTTGSALKAAVSVVSPEDGAGVARYSATSASDGFFTLPLIAPGTYILKAAAGTEAAAARIRIRNGDMRVDLRPGPGVAVRGRLVNASSVPMDLRGARIRLAEIEDMLSEPNPQSIAANNQFLFAGIQPGFYAPGIEGLPDDLYVKAATFGQMDALAKPLSISYPATAVPLEVEIGLDGGRIGGLVFDAGDRPYPAALVTLIPEGENRSRFDRYRTALAGDKGEFSIRGIAPGEYRLFAWNGAVPNAYLNVEYMRAYESLGIPVRILPGTNPSIGLRLIHAPR